MKKLLAIILATVMLLTVAVPAISAVGEEYLPIVYIEGTGMTLVDANGTIVYPYTDDILSLVVENASDLLKTYAKDAVINDYSEYADKLSEIISPIFSKYKNGKSGFPEDGSGLTTGAQWRGAGRLSNIKKTIPMTNGSYPVYRWHYDWRLSPITLAAELNDLIDAVLAETGAPKVNIISRCLGTNMAYAYLHKYGTDKVNSCVYYAPACMGIGVCSAMFSGEIKIDAGALNRFLDYYKNENNLVIQDEETTGLIFALVSVLEQIKVLNVGTDFVEKVVDAAEGDVIPRICKESFATFPSYWSMVEPEYYEQAKAFIFDGCEEEWADLIALTDEYYEMQKDFERFHKENSDKVHFSVITKYGFPCFPLSADAAEESDAYVTVGIASFGATAASSGGKLSDSYIKKAKAEGKGEYISADSKIDASTCLFPETTWFIKGLEHKLFPNCVNDLMIKFVNSNGEMTVNTDPAFTRFLQFKSTNNLSSDDVRGTLTPIITEQDTTDTTNNYKKNPFEALIDFFTRLFNYLTRLFTK